MPIHVVASRRSWFWRRGSLCISEGIASGEEQERPRKDKFAYTNLCRCEPRTWFWRRGNPLLPDMQKRFIII
jgi:hypothetical protein